MNGKRNRLLTAMFIAFVISYIAQKHVFTVNGEEIQPEVLVAWQNLPETFAAVTHSVTFEKAPTLAPTSTPSTIPSFPTTVAVTPIVVTQPLAPTMAPIVPTSTPLPTTVVYPTAPQRPTVTPRPTAAPLPTAVLPSPSTQNATMEDFGRCLKQKGMVMYSQPGCSACTQQKQLLGAAYSQITDISCPSKPEECSKVGVRTTPSWAKNGVMAIPGGTSLEYLAEVAGCQLPN